MQERERDRETKRDYLNCIMLKGNLTRQYPNQGAVLLPP